MSGRVRQTMQAAFQQNHITRFGEHWTQEPLVAIIGQLGFVSFNGKLHVRSVDRTRTGYR